LRGVAATGSPVIISAKRGPHIFEYFYLEKLNTLSEKAGTSRKL